MWHPNLNTLTRFAFHLFEKRVGAGTFKSCMTYMLHALNQQLVLKGCAEMPNGYLYSLTAVRLAKTSLDDHDRSNGITNCEDIQVAFHIIVLENPICNTCIRWHACTRFWFS